jgi:beta-lactamase class D
MMKKTLLFSLILILPQGIIAQEEIVRNAENYFHSYGFEGCFVLYSQKENNYIRYNESMCNERFLPASTFKVPHALIALEERIIRDTNQVISWNGNDYGNQDWNKDQTLKTAIQQSCIWVFIEFAKKIGIQKYQKYMHDFRYGNKNLSGPPTRFWLEGPFGISANEQTDFMVRFYNYELPVSEVHVDLLKEILILEQKKDYILSGKTGTGKLTENDYIFWLVGYLETEEDTYFFALNFISDNFAKAYQERLSIAKEIFHDLGIIN